MTLWKREEAAAGSVEAYLSGEDRILDQRILLWDCLGSIAHATMLGQREIISGDDSRALCAELRRYAHEAYEGGFLLEARDEDCHSALERRLTETLGETGKRVHTARSRNDQVLTALKLYIKASLFLVQREVLELAGKLLAFAEANPCPFPGYTHMQKAMPSTLALWGGAFVESLIDDSGYIGDAVRWLDSSPLGSAAGYGVSFPIDRALSAKLLGFARVQNNVIYAQNCRGKNELITLGALNAAMVDLNKLASDLIFFSLPELGYLTLPAEFCTGSSIMPQKKNPDVLEIVRGKTKIVGSLYSQVLGTASDLISGYNRDFQLTKRPVMEGLGIARGTLKIMTELMRGVEAVPEKCLAGLDPSIFATDVACDFVREGLPFREAYFKAKENLDKVTGYDIDKAVSGKRHQGAPGNPGLAELRRALGASEVPLQSTAASFAGAMSALVGFDVDLAKAAPAGYLSPW